MKQLLLPILTLLSCACTRMAVIDNDASAYTVTAYSPAHASGFELRSLPGDSTSLMLEVYRPDTMRIIIPRGGFSSLLCMSSTYVGALTSIGAGSKIAAVSGRDYITDPEVRSHAADVGYEGAMNYEALIAAKPDVALIYGIGGKSALAPKLEELSIPYVYVNDFEEQSPLGRAEWAVAIGALAGVDGQPFFAQVTEAYKPSDGNTSVMINAPYSGSWFIPGKDNYMSRLLSDAGAEITAPQTNGAESTTIDLEVALPALARARVWMCPGQASTLEQLNLMVPKASFAGPVWNQTADFYESGSSRPDLVVKELQSIMNATAPDSMRYFVRLR